MTAIEFELIELAEVFAGSVIYPPAQAIEVIAPLRQLGEPVMDLFAAMPPSGLVRIHMDPEDPVPGIVCTSSLREAPAEAFDAFVKAAGPESGSPLLLAQLCPLLLAQLCHAGGALASAPPGAGARSRLHGEHLFLGVGMAMGPEMVEPINQQIDAICQALQPWSTGDRYLNLADRPIDLEELFDAATLSRLRAVKAQYDPTG